MKRLLLLLTLVFSYLNATTHECTWYSIENKEDKSKIYLKQTHKVKFIETKNKLTVVMDDEYTVYQKTPHYIKDVIVYKNQEWQLLGVYSQFTQGVRIINDKYTLDFTDCTKLINKGNNK